MKYNFLSFFLLFSFNLCLLFSRPIITIEKNYIDLGTMSQETEREFDINIKNSGTSDLVIKKINTPCGCTNTSFTNKTITPDASAVLSIKFNSGFFHGDVNKYVEIVSNDPDFFYYTVYFKANVYKEFLIEPEQLEIKKIVRKYGSKNTIKIKSIDEKEFEINNIQFNNDLFNLSWLPNNKENNFHFEIDIQVKQNLNIDNFNELILFELKKKDDKNILKKSFFLSGKFVENDIYFEPVFLRLKKKENNYNAVLKSHTQTPFLIESIINKNIFYKVVYTKISESEYNLNIKIQKKLTSNFFDSIKIITSNPDEKEKKFKIMY